MEELRDWTNYLIAFRNKDGEEVTIDPNGGFDIILKTNYTTQVLRDCYMSLSCVNIPSFPYSKRSFIRDEKIHDDEMTIPNYSFDVYPKYYETITTPSESKKETDNVEVPVIDETEKLHNNLIHKLTDKK